MYATLVVALLYLIYVFRKRKIINLGIGLMGVSGRVVSNLYAVKFIPFIIIFISLGIGTLFLATLSLAFSIGDVKLITADSNNKYSFILYNVTRY